MKSYRIKLEDYVAMFYEKISQTAGIPVEQVLADSLFRAAGTLAQNAIGEMRSSHPRSNKKKH